MIMKTCIKCGRLIPLGTSRCAEHTLPRRSGTYSREAKRLVEAATYCYLCGDGPRPGDPFVADHVIPRALAGPDTLDNLAPAHRSCNGRKGARLVGLP